MSDEGRFSFFAAPRWHRFVAGHAPLEPPERRVRLAKRLLPRYANVLEQVDIVLLGDFPQRPALTRARDPSTDRRTYGGDRAFRLGFAVRHDAGGSHRRPTNHRREHDKSSELGVAPGQGSAGRSRINKSRGLSPTKHRFSVLAEIYSLDRR